MKQRAGTIATLLVIGLALAGSSVAAEPAGQRHAGREGHARHASPGSRGAGPSTAARRAALPHPLVAPFPDIATLSGPLPTGFNPPLVAAGQDLFRMRGRFNTQPFFAPGFAYGAYADMTGPDEAPPATPPAVETGFLRLAVSPASAQVFVDGYYAGTVDDIDRARGLDLAAGPHRVEIRARGYESTTVDIRIVAREAVTYRATLEPQLPTRAVAAPSGPSTIYVIPGCYMGNVPPRQDRVGPGCDVARTRVVSPLDATQPSR